MQSDRRTRAIGEIGKRIETREQEIGAKITQKEIWRIKLEVCREFALDSVPKNSEILQVLSPQSRAQFIERLKRKSVRTRSGIAVITVITKPFNCPHGTCTFCPGGVRFGTPQSYTKNSPAASFGLSRGFDPSRQVEDMLSILRNNGHDTSKVELILLGGTILAMPKDYQENFVKASFDALNGTPSSSLEEAIRRQREFKTQMRRADD